LPVGVLQNGPAVVESAFTSVAIDEARFRRSEAGSLVIEL
jgi:hypothetical protein